MMNLEALRVLRAWADEGGEGERELTEPKWSRNPSIRISEYRDGRSAHCEQPLDAIQSPGHAHVMIAMLQQQWLDDTDE